MELVTRLSSWAVVLAVVLTLGSTRAQTKGVAPSVTSQGFGNHSKTAVVPTGPPASITSLGPRGFTRPCVGPGATPLIPAALGCQDPTAPMPPNRHRHPRNNFGYGYGYGYAPYYDNSDMGTYAENGNYPDASAMPEPEPPAPTIFENRPPAEGSYTYKAGYGDHYLDSRERARPAEAPAAPPAEPVNSVGARDDGNPIVLVFRDGHVQTVMNYAIVGQTLYDLNGSYAKKIPLAALDLPATVQANEEQGVEFKLPASVRND